MGNVMNVFVDVMGTNLFCILPSQKEKRWILPPPPKKIRRSMRKKRPLCCSRTDPWWHPLTIHCFLLWQILVERVMLTCPMCKPDICFQVKKGLLLSKSCHKKCPTDSVHHHLTVWKRDVRTETAGTAGWQRDGREIIGVTRTIITTTTTRMRCQHPEAVIILACLVCPFQRAVTWAAAIPLTREASPTRPTRLMEDISRMSSTGITCRRLVMNTTKVHHLTVMARVADPMGMTWVVCILTSTQITTCLLNITTSTMSWVITPRSITRTMDTLNSHSTEKKETGTETGTGATTKETDDVTVVRVKG